MNEAPDEFHRQPGRAGRNPVGTFPTAEAVKTGRCGEEAGPRPKRFKRVWHHFFFTWARTGLKFDPVKARLFQAEMFTYFEVRTEGGLRLRNQN